MLVLLAAIRLIVLPVPGPAAGADTAKQVVSALEQTLAGMRGVELVRWTELSPGLDAKAKKIRARCGDQRDCQLALGALVKANLLVLTRVEPMEAGALVELDFVDLGTKRSKRKLSRTLSCSAQHQRDVLEHILTDSLFPERMVGRIEIRLEPAGGDIYLDDRLKLRAAPAQVNLENIREGRHTLRIEKPGFKDFIAFIQVPFKGVSVLEVQLRKAE